MNSCKVMQSQAKAMTLTWSAARGYRTGLVRFQGTKKCPDKGEELNAILTRPVKEIQKIK